MASDWPRPLPAGRRALFTAAGPLANLVAAPVLLVVPAPVWVRWPAALLCGGTGVANLVPHHFRDGRASDGAVLAGLPAQRKAEASLRRLTASPGWQDRADAVDRLLTGYQRKAPEALGRIDTIAVLLRKNGRIEDLLAFHARDFLLSDGPSPATVVAVHGMEWAVLTVAGLPQPAADLAARRLDWVLRHSAAGTLHEVQHTLALARLRQRRYAEVEPLCAGALARPLTAAERATVLATVAMARNALGRDYQSLLNEALALDPAPVLVSEASRLAPDPAPPGATAGWPA